MLRRLPREDASVPLAERARRPAIVYGAIGLGRAPSLDAAHAVTNLPRSGLGAGVAVLAFSDGRNVKARRRGMDLDATSRSTSPSTSSGTPP